MVLASTYLDAVAFRLALRDIVSPLAVDGHRVHADIGKRVHSREVSDTLTEHVSD